MPTMQSLSFNILFFFFKLGVSTNRFEYDRGEGKDGGGSGSGNGSVGYVIDAAGEGTSLQQRVNSMAYRFLFFGLIEYGMKY